MTDTNLPASGLRKYPQAKAQAEEENRDLEIYKADGGWWIRRVGSEHGIPATRYERQLWKQAQTWKREAEKAWKKLEKLEGQEK
jgi:hypothetical protein